MPWVSEMTQVPVTSKAAQQGLAGFKHPALRRHGNSQNLEREVPDLESHSPVRQHYGSLASVWEASGGDKGIASHWAVPGCWDLWSLLGVLSRSVPTIVLEGDELSFMQGDLGHRQGDSMFLDQYLSSVCAPGCWATGLSLAFLSGQSSAAAGRHRPSDPHSSFPGPQLSGKSALLEEKGVAEGGPRVGLGARLWGEGHLV